MPTIKKTEDTIIFESGAYGFTERSDPTGISNTGFVYVKDVSGVSELFYIDDVSTVTQLTANGSIPSTIPHLIEWGTTKNEIIASNGDLVTTTGGTQRQSISSTGAFVLNHEGFNLSGDADIVIDSQGSNITVSAGSDYLNSSGYQSYTPIVYTVTATGILRLSSNYDHNTNLDSIIIETTASTTNGGRVKIDCAGEVNIDAVDHVYIDSVEGCVDLKSCSGGANRCTLYLGDDMLELYSIGLDSNISASNGGSLDIYTTGAGHLNFRTWTAGANITLNSAEQYTVTAGSVISIFANEPTADVGYGVVAEKGIRLLSNEDTKIAISLLAPETTHGGILLDSGTSITVRADSDFNTESLVDTTMSAGGDFTADAEGNIDLRADGNFDISTNATAVRRVRIESDGDFDIDARVFDLDASLNINMDTSASINLTASGSIVSTATGTNYIYGTTQVKIESLVNGSISLESNGAGDIHIDSDDLLTLVSDSDMLFQCGTTSIEAMRIVSASTDVRFGSGTKLTTGGEASPDVDDGGLCLDQNAGSAKILSFKANVSSGYHPFSNYAEIDTYGYIERRDDAYGGLMIVGMCDALASSAMHIMGMDQTPSTSTTTSATGAILLTGADDNGSGGAQGILTNSNILVVRNYSSARMILKGDGQLYNYYNASMYTFDDEDDLALVRATQCKIGGIEPEVEAMKRLVELGIINEDGFGSQQQMTRLQMGAIHQMFNGLKFLAQKMGITDIELSEMMRA